VYCARFGRFRSTRGGDVQALLPKVAERVRILSERRAERVHLIGQSLGGVLARELYSAYKLD